MTQAICPACNASIDLSLKPPSSSFPCPRCGQGEIRVPPPALDEIEELDASLEVKEGPPALDTVEELDASLEIKEQPPARPRISRSAGATLPRRGSRLTRAPRTERKAGPPMMLIGGVAVVLIAALAVIFLRSGDEPPAGPGANPSTESGAEMAAAIDLTPAEKFQLGLEALTPGDLGGRLALAQQCVEHGLAEERTRLLREVLLLDGANAEARSAFGFLKYEGPVSRFQGKWLDAEEIELAKQFEPSSEPEKR
ncbi:MAG: hypothetical protein V2A76_14445 [Planctomycetota bacterium]